MGGPVSAPVDEKVWDSAVDLDVDLDLEPGCVMELFHRWLGHCEEPARWRLIFRCSCGARGHALSSNLCRSRFLKLAMADDRLVCSHCERPVAHAAARFEPL